MQSPWLRNEQENAIVCASTPVKRTVSESNKLLQGRVEVDGSRPGLVQSCFDRQKGFSSGPRGCCCFFAPPPPPAPPLPWRGLPFWTFLVQSSAGPHWHWNCTVRGEVPRPIPNSKHGQRPRWFIFSVFFGVCFSRNEIFVGVCTIIERRWW